MLNQTHSFCRGSLVLQADPSFSVVFPFERSGFSLMISLDSSLLVPFLTTHFPGVTHGKNREVSRMWFVNGWSPVSVTETRTQAWNPNCMQLSFQWAENSCLLSCKSRRKCPCASNGVALPTRDANGCVDIGGKTGVEVSGGSYVQFCLRASWIMAERRVWKGNGGNI